MWCVQWPTEHHYIAIVFRVEHTWIYMLCTLPHSEFKCRISSWKGSKKERERERSTLHTLVSIQSVCDLVHRKFCVLYVVILYYHVKICIFLYHLSLWQPTEANGIMLPNKSVRVSIGNHYFDSSMTDEQRRRRTWWTNTLITFLPNWITNRRLMRSLQFGVGSHSCLPFVFVPSSGHRTSHMIDDKLEENRTSHGHGVKIMIC